MAEFVKIYDLPNPVAKTATEEDKLYKNYYLNFNSAFMRTQAELNKEFDDFFAKCLFDVYKKQNISHVIVLSEPEFKNFLIQMLPLYRSLNKENATNNNHDVISRDELYENINRIFGSVDKFLDIVEEDRPCCYISFKDEDDYVVIDSRAHRYISWYKHVGRGFDTDMETKEEVISFLERLYNNWKKEYDEEGKV